MQCAELHIPYMMKQQASRCGHSIVKTVHSHDHKVYATLAIMYSMLADLQWEVR